jgi:hypothetical protein
MRKQKILRLIILALVALLFCAGPGAAKSKKIKFEVEMCRELTALVAADVSCPGGTPIVNEDGIITGCENDARWHTRGGQNLWTISEGDEGSNGDEFVVGKAILDLDMNCDGPPPISDKHCISWGTFELIPSAYCNEFGESGICTDVSGSWVGTFNARYHGGYWAASFEGYGTGDLEGLRIKAYDWGPTGKPQICTPAGEPRPLTGYIYPDDDKDDDEEEDLRGWGPDHNDD